MTNRYLTKTQCIRRAHILWNGIQTKLLVQFTPMTTGEIQTLLICRGPAGPHVLLQEKALLGSGRGFRQIVSKIGLFVSDPTGCPPLITKRRKKNVKNACAYF